MNSLPHPEPPPDPAADPTTSPAANPSPLDPPPAEEHHRIPTSPATESDLPQPNPPGAASDEDGNENENNDAPDTGTDTDTDTDRDELEDWKDALRHDFETWLESLDAIPDLPQEPSPANLNDAPDLASFQAQLAAANAESRKANRRTAEAISQWGDTLARFERSLEPLRQSASQLAAVQPKDDQLSNPHCLVLVEFLDRMLRLAQAFATPPPTRTSWWRPHDPAWPKAWTTQQQALEILIDHLDAFLRKQGVVRIDTTNQPFDPTLMIAVAAEPDPNRPPQTILEVVLHGYRRHNTLLRPAQVKVSRLP